MQDLGKNLMIFGVVLFAAGLLLVFMNLIPLLGKLPGDFLVQKKNFTFYFPLATSILISVIISAILWLCSRR
jgi:hypothetical protein